MRVLIVDDSAVVRRLMEERIRALGHECVVATDGAEAWELFRLEIPDVVISDWLMPRMDGDELCRRIRSADGPYAYFILLTSLDDKSHLQRGMEAGADDFLVKPPDREELGARLVAAARVTALHRRLAQQQAELERLNRAFHAQARRDPLTGLSNRLRLQEDLEVLEGRHQRYGDTYAVVLVDIDHFKSYNDAFGHASGDDILRIVARTIEAASRPGDSVYRFGGEEILIILPQQDLAGAAAAAERLRAGIETLGVEHAPAAPAAVVTISAGIAVREDSAGSAEVLQAADAALYEAKEAGRNRIQVARPATRSS